MCGACLPARSQRVSLPTVRMPVARLVDVTSTMRSAWLREECALMSWAATHRFSYPRLITSVICTHA